ncbi:universal stress protein [Wenzhouxiangella limi]|uniref:Universal stress protein n=1 Tax=Wenzhouxiangella limi TaxID=2707351 RepID=A0A845UZN3_9GAMM|nr:universal stress protein [Wenzhouxiangella limi]NDY96228.1 universal stress protein [Wenzhouxiangella limi]
MQIMLAYDHSRNSRIVLDGTKRLFKDSQPEITLICVVEEPRSSTSVEDHLFQSSYDELKTGAETAAAELTDAGFPTRVLMAEGDARKMILRATLERNPDMLVMCRHSHKAEGGFFSRTLEGLVEEFDHMTFGSVSAFLARRVQCPLLIIPAP